MNKKITMLALSAAGLAVLALFPVVIRIRITSTWPRPS